MPRRSSWPAWTCIAAKRGFLRRLKRAEQGIGELTGLMRDIRGGKGTVGKLMTDERLYAELHAFVVSANELATGLQAKLESSNHAGQEQQQTETELERKLDRLQNLVDELSEVGCELKDYQTGLVDFVGRHQGRDVYLCWKLGEGKIAYWHELQTGFAGRQPVSVLDERD